MANVVEWEDSKKKELEAQLSSLNRKALQGGGKIKSAAQEWSKFVSG
jgi:hypothetical protein